MARLILPEDEVLRMQNIRNGVGCPHGRLMSCKPCGIEVLDVKKATEQFSQEFADAAKRKTRSTK